MATHTKDAALTYVHALATLMCDPIAYLLSTRMCIVGGIACFTRLYIYTTYCLTPTHAKGEATPKIERTKKR